MSIRKHDRKARREGIRGAFSRAIELEARPFNLKGRGHEPRTTLKPHIVRFLTDLDLPCVSVSRGYSHANYYPLRLVNKAAQLLDVEPSQFTNTIDLASDGPGPRPTTWTAPDGTIHRRIPRRQVAQLLRPGTRLTLINSSLGLCSESKIVISATIDGFVCDDRPRNTYANVNFGRFDAIFFDLTKSIITIKNGDKLMLQYRIESTPTGKTQ